MYKNRLYLKAVVCLSTHVPRHQSLGFKYLDVSISNKGIISMSPGGGELSTSDNESTVSLHVDSVTVAKF